MQNSKKLSFEKTFTQVFDVITGQHFFDLSEYYGEVPIYICPFDPTRAPELTEQVERLSRRIEGHSGNIKVLNINLYKTSVEILEEKGYLSVIEENETEYDKNDLLESLAGVLDPRSTLKDAILEKMNSFETKCSEDESRMVVFLTGVGEVYPYVRTHVLISNLEEISAIKPTVIFFPGSYQRTNGVGSSLILFDRQGDTTSNRHYRSTNILECRP